MIKILIVEDDANIAKLVEATVAIGGYEGVVCTNGAEAFEKIEHENFDLILLDVMLPDMSGFEIMQKRTNTDSPVIFITAKQELTDKVRGLRAGADDYLSKPFQIGELLARVEAVLRRMGIGAKQLELGDVVIFTDSRQVMKGGVPVTLTVKEFDLLVELVQNKNIALYRDQLYEKVWKEPFMGETRTLDAHIQRLRRKLGWEDRIKTVFRIGYRLEG